MGTLVTIVCIVLVVALVVWLLRFLFHGRP